MQTIKCVVVGDGVVGKTCLLNSYITKESSYMFPCVPTWVPEISFYCPGMPFLLVGTQVDLRDDSNTLKKLANSKQRALTCENGEKLARELKAVKYVECSALTQRGVQNVFDKAVLAALAPRGSKSKKHCILL